MLSSGLGGGVLNTRLQPLHGFIDPGCLAPAASLSKLITHSGPHPHHETPDCPNVIQSNQMLLGSKGRISKVNSQRVTHISALLPDLNEDTTAETPVGG